MFRTPALVCKKNNSQIAIEESNRVFHNKTQRHLQAVQIHMDTNNRKGIQNVVRVRCAIQTISRKIRVLLNTIILFNIHFIASLGQNANGDRILIDDSYYKFTVEPMI
ncbi:hypothetical protein YC2023_045362 [Brassica napus]